MGGWSDLSDERHLISSLERTSGKVILERKRGDCPAGQGGKSDVGCYRLVRFSGRGGVLVSSGKKV